MKNNLAFFIKLPMKFIFWEHLWSPKQYSNTICCIPNTRNLNKQLFRYFFVGFSNGLISWLGRPLKFWTYKPIKQTFLSRFQTTILKPDHSTTEVRYSECYCSWEQLGSFTWSSIKEKAMMHTYKIATVMIRGEIPQA